MSLDIVVISCSSYYLDAQVDVITTASMFIRQEAGKTFRYDETNGNEVVIMDMTLEEGDVFVRPNGETLSVEKVETDADDVKIIYLKGTDSNVEDIWRSDIGSVKSGLLQVDDISGVTIDCYQDNGYWVSGNRNKYYYPETNNEVLKQISYYTEKIGSSGGSDLDFSFEGDSLHIKGMYSFDGDGSNYQVIQCIIEGNNIYLNFVVDKNHAPKYGHWGYDDYYYDLKIGGFKTGIYSIYNMWISGGRGIQAICGDVDYRPFIEEGKVWKVGEINTAHSIDETYCLHYYYFDGDTVIMDEPNLYMIGPCKKMMCHDVVNDQYPLDDGSLEATRYVGAMYEQQKKVYIIIPDETEPVLLYDFSLKPGETGYVATGGWTSDLSEIKVTSKAYVNNEDFKGNYLEWIVYDVATGEWEESSLNGWMEGIGYTIEPIHNGVENIISPRITTLMQCTVGDEVIYNNPDIIDGVNPPADETKKRIDFTHIQKPRPKAPRQETDGVQLSGEYTLNLLDLDLRTMSDTYNVTITDNAGKKVYEKAVRTADVLALNIDISQWTAPTYTITVESDSEQYVGTFSPTPTSITELTDPKVGRTDNAIYDLTGRRLTHEPARGLYIRNGRIFRK